MNRSSSTNVSVCVAVPSPSKWNSRSKGTGGKQKRVPLLPFRLGGGRVQQHKCLHWDANLNLKHISHAWITKHFNWTKFHNPKIKVFHIQWLIRQLFGQVDRKRTQFHDTISLITPNSCKDMQCNESTNNANPETKRTFFYAHFSNINLGKFNKIP